MKENDLTTPIQGIALSSKTEGEICLRYSPSILFKVAKIAYEVFADGSFQYSFFPYYDVIDALPSSCFQGIPGVNLDRRLAVYYRVNMTPVYVSERSPEPSRVNLQSLLKEAHMAYLNRLEWMIKTNHSYTGDRLVTKPFGFDNYAGMDQTYKYARSVSVLKMLGMRLPILIDGVSFSDGDRTVLLKSHFLDYERVNAQRSKAIEAGQQKAKKNGVYRGRKPKIIAEPMLEEAERQISQGAISVQDAANKFGVSRTTLWRRLEEYRRR